MGCITQAGRQDRRETVILLLCVAAAWVTLLVFNIEQWVDFYRIARIGLSRTPEGYVYHELLTVGIALVILGIPAALIGAVLPLMIRAMSAGGCTTRGASRCVAHLEHVGRRGRHIDHGFWIDAILWITQCLRRTGADAGAGGFDPCIATGLASRHCRHRRCECARDRVVLSLVAKLA